MRENRLLDRIRFVKNNPKRRVSDDPSQMIHSVRGHLQRILNTRQGNALIAEDFGVPDFTNFTSAYQDSQRELELSLQQTIRKFEPRLQEVRVEFFPKEDDKMYLMFQISGRLVFEDHNEPISFKSRVDSGGHFMVKR